MNEANQLNTLAEAREQLRISNAKLFQLIRDGELPTVRIDRRRFVRAIDLDAFVEARLVSK